jgi:hypothetical protein
LQAARVVGIERQAGEIASLEAGIVPGHIRDVHGGKMHHPEFQEPQHRPVVDAHLVERRDVGRNGALRGLGDRLAPERQLVDDRHRGGAVEPDHLELRLRQILREATRHHRGAERAPCQQTLQHVQSSPARSAITPRDALSG